MMLSKLNLCGHTYHRNNLLEHKYCKDPIRVAWLLAILAMQSQSRYPLPIPHPNQQAQYPAYLRPQSVAQGLGPQSVLQICFRWSKSSAGLIYDAITVWVEMTAFHNFIQSVLCLCFKGVSARNSVIQQVTSSPNTAYVGLNNPQLLMLHSISARFLTANIPAKLGATPTPISCVAHELASNAVGLTSTHCEPCRNQDNASYPQSL